MTVEERLIADLQESCDRHVTLRYQTLERLNKATKELHAERRNLNLAINAILAHRASKWGDALDLAENDPDSVHDLELYEALDDILLAMGEKT